MVKGVDQGLLLGVFGSRTNLAQHPHRGDMVHTGSNWSYPLLGFILPLLAMQPLGITSTEKQARWLVVQKDSHAALKEYLIMEPRTFENKLCGYLKGVHIPSKRFCIPWIMNGTDVDCFINNFCEKSDKFRMAPRWIVPMDVTHCSNYNSSSFPLQFWKALKSLTFHLYLFFTWRLQDHISSTTQ